MLNAETTIVIPPRNTENRINDKIITTDQYQTLSRTLNILRFKSNTIAFTNGCFDLLHQGHIHCLAQTANLADFVIVGLNTDASVQRLKGPKRPLQSQQARAQILGSLFYVNMVVLFDEDTPYELIKLIQPDVLTKGGDYHPDSIVGADIVKNNGGQVTVIPFLDGHSTTKLIS